jgi:exonuclease VII small subunit
MSLGDIAQLSRQLQQVLAAASQQMAPVRSDLESAIAPGPDTGLQ